MNHSTCYLPVLLFSLLLHSFLPAAANGNESEWVSVVATGDVTLGYHFEEYLVKEPLGETLQQSIKEYPWVNVGKVVKDADITLVNLECPFTMAKEKVAKNFAFKANPKLVELLIEGGVDVVTLANNHNMDYQSAGVEETIKTLDSANIAHFGAGMNLAEARKAAILTVRDKKIGFIGYLHLGKHSIEPSIIWAGPDKAGMAGHSSDTDAVENMIKEDLAALVPKSDIQIVVFHWGKETTHYPLDYQKRLAKAAIDGGADAVIAHHPHVLQGIEAYKGVPIFYSLGNFIFGGHWNPGDKKSVIAKLFFGKENKTTRIELFPVLIDETPKYPFRPRFAKGKDYDIVKNRLVEYSSAFGDASIFKSDIAVDWKGEGVE